MARNTQYQPVAKSMKAAQEIHYVKEFKQADIAGGYRKPKVKQAKRENTDLK